MEEKGKIPPSVNKSIIVPVLERFVRGAAFISPYYWISRIMRRRWRDDELIPFWFAEVYVLVFLLALGVIFFAAPSTSLLFRIAVLVAGYRLVDLAFAITGIFLFETKRRRDEQGGYILVRNHSRWIALTFLNLLEILLYFAYFHLAFGSEYNPMIQSPLAALYQSAAEFIAGGGAVPTQDTTRALGLVNFLYFVFFFVLLAPRVFSVIRAKEQTSEQLGKNVGPDERL